MNRNIVMGLMGLGAVVSLAVLWPTQNSPMSATAIGCTVAPPTPGEGMPKGAEPQTERSAVALWLRSTVKLTPLVTGEQYLAYHQDVAALLPHVNANDLMKLTHFCPTDVNRDDRVDAMDLAFFAHAWALGDTSAGRLIDVNGDGVLDEQDYSAFMDAYFSSDCSPAEQQQYRWTIC